MNVHRMPNDGRPEIARLSLDLGYVKNFPYNPAKADRWDMLALLMAEERWPDKSIRVRNTAGHVVCGTVTPGSAETIEIVLPI
jgi:hypothetical protein